jgi:ABC-2 type transport system permease protein
MKDFAGKIHSRYRYSMILIKEFVKVNFKLRYQDSILGYVWAPLKPLFLFSITYIVFTKGLHIGTGTPNWATSLMFGTTLFSFFSEITSSSVSAIAGQANTIRKINFPKYVIIIASSVSALINLCINFVPIFVFAFVQHIHFSARSLMVIPYIVELYIFAIGIGFFLSTCFVFFRDLANIWDILVQMLMYVSVVMYPIGNVAKHSQLLAEVALFNPIAQIIQDIRYFFCWNGTETLYSISGKNIFIYCIPFVVTILIFMFGAYIFRTKSPYFAEDV